MLLHQQAMSMAFLHETFGLETNGNRYPHKLKECLINDYRNKIMFVRSHYHHPEIVIGVNSVNSNLLLNNKDVINSKRYNRISEQSTRNTLASSY